MEQRAETPIFAHTRHSMKAKARAAGIMPEAYERMYVPQWLHQSHHLCQPIHWKPSKS